MDQLSRNFQEIESLMCGRYALYGPSSRHREHFATEDEFDLPPRYNVAPSQVLPVVRQTPEGKRIFTFAKAFIRAAPATAEEVPKDTANVTERESRINHAVPVGSV